MVIKMSKMYLGETAEVIAINNDVPHAKRLRDMGIREGKLIDLIHCDTDINQKVIIRIDNSQIAFDIAIAEAITVRPLKSYYEVVRVKAMLDPLTGCLNRHSMDCILMREYEKFSAYKIPLSLLLTDIDYFKRINDTYGHSIGDSVLRNISALFKQLLRRSDILFRWGGEEFLILLRGTTINEAIQIAERVRQAVENNVFHPFQGAGFVTVSIGICGLPPDRDLDELIDTADKALYNAKNNGRNRVSVW